MIESEGRRSWALATFIGCVPWPRGSFRALLTVTSGAGLVLLLACGDGPATPGDLSSHPTQLPASAFEADGQAGGESAALQPQDGGARTAVRASRVSLVSHAVWQPAGADLDPFADRPPTVACSEQAASFEMLAGDPAYGVDTGACNYLTVSQQTLERVTRSERLVIRVWHFALTASEPAQAHAAVMLDGDFLLDEQIAIPSQGALITRELTATRDYPAGAPIHFHLHNHGDNSWALIEVSTGP